MTASSSPPSREAGGTLCKYTELTGEGHGISGIVYAKPELHDWIFSLRKGGATLRE